ncbi:YjaG family protein [Neptunicella sp. SCSIO 80796]|uniref:YjaG family protein n=1 Tax=Neptunicella plasticusilytica TaxID=3117012 RepID=UPI003A4E5253
MTKKLNIFAQVRELSGWQAVAFAATLVERMLPNYNLFCEACDFGDPAQYRKTLNSIWESLASPKSKINFAAQLEKIETAIPDAADFDVYGVYPAIDVCMSMTALILLIMDDDPQGAVVVSKLSQGSVEAFVEAAAAEEIDDTQIKQHPLMQWEISFQADLLGVLASTRPDAGLFKQLKAMATEEGMSNIGIDMQELSPD